MNKNTYRCTNCKKTFTRKFNAERHNKDVHNEMAILYNDKTGWSSNKRITNTEPIHPKANNVDLVKRALNFDINDFKTGYSDFYDNTNTDELRIFNIFGKIYPLVEELDKSLSDIPHLERINTVADIIIISLMSSNPVKSLKDAINFHHSIKGLKKASAFVAASKNNSLDQAQGMLKGIYFGSALF